MKALSGQTLFDIAIQFSGSAEAAFELTVLNGLNLTDDLVPGVELKQAGVLNQQVAAYYLAKQIMPATLEAQIITGLGMPVDILSQVQSNVLKVISGQTLFDLALQSSGSIEAAFEMAFMNELNMTDEIVPGLNLKTPAVLNKAISDYYKNREIKPATGMSGTSPDGGIGGIEYWAIETEFIVS